MQKLTFEFPEIDSVLGFSNVPGFASNQKIRIGYVSYDFADHPLAHLLNSLFSLHDRSKFQVIGFSLRPDDHSAWKRNIEQSCDEFY